MATDPETHYDTLGVAEDASPGEIARAYQRLDAQFDKDTTPPDPRRRARIQKAYEVLFDTARREEYDDSLPARSAAPARRSLVAMGVAGVAALGVAAYFLAGRMATPETGGRPGQQFRAEVDRSVGRVQAIDIAGNAVTTGMAFTVSEGIMVTACDGLAPGAQIVVLIGTRRAPARISTVDETLGLCKLAVDGAGSWPLAVGGPAPRVGDKVFAPVVNAAGEVALAEGTVKRVAMEGERRIVEASVPAAAGTGGRPLLDAGGRVVAAALAAAPAAGAVRHVVIESAWAQAPPASAMPAAPAPVESPPDAAKGPKAPMPLPDPVQRRAEELARKLRPPPTVPDDI